LSHRPGPTSDYAGTNIAHSSTPEWRVKRSAEAKIGSVSPLRPESPSRLTAAGAKERDLARVLMKLLGCQMLSLM
jgi:hypothetical protein